MDEKKTMLPMFFHYDENYDFLLIFDIVEIFLFFIFLVFWFKWGQK
jgi:hypothetical protein